MRKIDQLKAAVNFEAAGAFARLLRHPRYYGCHAGMRSTLEADMIAFYRGYDLPHYCHRVTIRGVDYMINSCADNINIRRKIISPTRASYWRAVKTNSGEFHLVLELLPTL